MPLDCLYCFAIHTDNQSEVAFPSYKRIQSMTGWSAKTVAKAVEGANGRWMAESQAAV
jgi:hypothetical protein